MNLKSVFGGLFILALSGCASSVPEMVAPVAEEVTEVEETEVSSVATKTIIDTFGFSFELPEKWIQKVSEDDTHYLMAVVSPSANEDMSSMDLNYLDIQVWFNYDSSNMSSDEQYEFFDLIAEGYAEDKLQGKVEWTTERVVFAGKPALILTYEISKGSLTIEHKLYHFIHNGNLFLMESSREETLDTFGAQELDVLLNSFTTF